MQHSEVVLLLIIGLFGMSSQSNVEYIIAPVYVPSKQQCHNCLTLTQFATNSSHYLRDNTTLILQPGIHMLNSRLVVSDVEKFTLYHISEPGDTVSCNGNSNFFFDTVQSVYISNLHLKECFGNKVTNTKHFDLLNSSFTGSFFVTSGTALEVTDTTAILTHCFFTKYYYGTYRTTISSKPYNMSFVQRTKKWIGGAMIITHSNVAIVKSHFEENRAQAGGAVHAENHSNVTINETSFIFNTANSSLYSGFLDQTATGGALYAVHNCSIFVYNSYFERNEVYFGYRLGGAIAVYRGSLHIIGSILTNNNAERGGVAYLMESSALFKHCELSSNSALYSGGVLVAINSSIYFHSSDLMKNRAPRGGVVYVSDSAIMIIYCNFTSNFATGHAVGGVIYAEVESSISMKSCVFESNFALRGAVMRVERSRHDLKVKSCVFLDNRAELEGGVFFFTTPIIYNMHIVDKYTKMFIKQSTFLSNKAGTKGGVLYSQDMYNDLVIEDSDNVYKKNSANSGGVMYISHVTLVTSHSYIDNNIATEQGIVVLISTKATYSGIVTFQENLASALVAIKSEVTFSGKINFTANKEQDPTYSLDEQLKGGAITSVLSIITFNANSILSSNEAYYYGGAICSINSNIHLFGDSTFSNNLAAKGGGIYLYQSELHCKNQIIFLENHANSSGGGIHSLNSFIRLSLRGSQLYMRNYAELGGGIFLARNSRINIRGIAGLIGEGKWDLRIRLIHNVAFYGGGIFIDDETNPLSCSRSSLMGSDSECFFQAQIRYASTNITYVFFSLNEAAKGGSNLYGGLFDRCRSSSVNSAVEAVEYLQGFSNILKASVTISSKPVRVCFCKGSKPDCDYQPSPVNVTKGQAFVLTLVAVDQVNNSLPATIYAYTVSHASGLSVGQRSQYGFEVCTNLTYEVKSHYSSETLILYADGPCKNSNLSSRSVHIHFLPCHCPAGFMVSSESKSVCKCLCHEQLNRYLKNCNSTTSLLLRNTNAWIDIVSDNVFDAEIEGYLVHPHCPYDYCFPPSPPVHINLNIEDGADAQCAFNRSGVLCGACKPTFSLALGSSRCLQCSNIWIILLIPFCLAGIALVVSILMLNLTISKGTINCIVFFSNVVIANRAILIPLNTYNFLAMFVSWLSLDLGIETCFVDGLDAYGKSWLQFLFPTYIFVLVFMIVVISHYSQKFSNLLGGRNPIATLAMLIWLSNAKIFRTILSVVSFTVLKYPDNSSVPLWFPDGNIHYLRGKHIPLFLVAVFILIAAVLYIFVVLFWQWLICLPKCKIMCWIRNTKVVSFMDAHHAPYKGKHRYWPGLLLLVSMMQYFISAFNVTGDPTVNVFAIIVLVTTLTVYKSSVLGVYRNWSLDILETTIHFNLILFAASTMYIMYAGGNQIILANISLSIVFITLVFIIGYHVLALFSNNIIESLVERLNWRRQRSMSIDFSEKLIDDGYMYCDADSHQLYEYCVPGQRRESNGKQSNINYVEASY